MDQYISNQGIIKTTSKIKKYELNLSHMNSHQSQSRRNYHAFGIKYPWKKASYDQNLEFYSE